ncbi:MAG: hypothetical protein FGM55_16645, partial [Rhodoferax sp.]|nr:hypothetical protein [Rhodoferax sp.]
ARWRLVPVRPHAGQVGARGPGAQRGVGDGDRFPAGRGGALPQVDADVNYAVRWLKANAARLKTRPDAIGLSGNSSGGHMAMLAAMRPFDPRYTEIPLPGGESFDATVNAVVMLWPVINPLGRYNNTLRMLQQPNPPDWCELVVKLHHRYWSGKDDMADGNPMLMLERGERVATPPAMWIQATEDEVHNYTDPDSPYDGPELERFAHNYRAAGGEIELKVFEAPPMFTTVHPTLPASIEALGELVRFVHQHVPEPR